jgi:hypothetical protein
LLLQFAGYLRMFADPKLTATMRLRGDSPAIDAGATPGADIGALEHERGGVDQPAERSELHLGSWSLVSHLGEDDASRAQLVFLQSALEQYGERGLVGAVSLPGGASSPLVHDWNLGAIRTFAPGPSGVEKLPTTLLVGPDGAVVRRWEGFAPPADLGLTLRALIGPPAGSPAVELPRDAEDAPRLRDRVGVSGPFVPDPPAH